MRRWWVLRDALGADVAGWGERAPPRRHPRGSSAWVSARHRGPGQRRQRAQNPPGGPADPARADPLGRAARLPGQLAVGRLGAQAPEGRYGFFPVIF